MELFDKPVLLLQGNVGIARYARRGPIGHLEIEGIGTVEVEVGIV